MQQVIEHSLLRFPSCSLEGLSSVKLLDRVDTKFVIPVSLLPVLLERIVSGYEVLELNGARIHPYDTLYFDTPTLDFYHLHHNGWKPRRKVRIRHYSTNGKYFLEHKFKRKYRTKKKRVERPDFSVVLSDEELSFLRDKGVAERMEPSLRVRFNRITLRALDGSERCTIDLGLEVAPAPELTRYTPSPFLPDFSPIVIVELKQSHYRRNSLLYSELRELGFRPQSWSKYAVGCALSFTGIKYNRLKEQKSLLEKYQTLSSEVM